MTSKVMLRLGEFGFSIDTASYSALSTHTTAKIGSADRVGITPAKQFTGWDQTKTIKGTVYPYWRGGRGQIPKMRQMVKSGVPLLLVDSLGTVHGYWYLESLNDDESRFSPDGIAQKWDFTLALSYYGERPPK